MALLRKRIPVSKPVVSDSEETTDDLEVQNVSNLVKYSEEQKKSPLRAIRQMCLNCCEGSAQRVERCDLKECPIHHMRFGKGVFKKKGHKGRVLSEEHKAKLLAGRKRRLEQKNEEA